MEKTIGIIIGILILVIGVGGSIFCMIMEERARKRLSLLEEEDIKNHELRNLIPTVINIESERKHSVREKDDTVMGEYVSHAYTQIKTDTGITVKGNYAGGTRSPNSKKSTPKEILDVMVSNLRRYFYWEDNVSAKLAEEIIDLKLKDMDAEELFGYKKSERKEPKNGYAPLKNQKEERK